MNQRDYDDYADELSDDDYGAEYDELFFDDDEPPEVGERLPDTDIERQQPPLRARQAGLTAASVRDASATLDDAAPETLTVDDGARSPDEVGGEATATDQRLSKTRVDNIGAGSGLDEAELVRAQPLDQRPWEDSPGEPLTRQPTPEPGRPNPGSY